MKSVDVADNGLTGADVNEGALDGSVLQKRVGSSCAAGNAIRAIASAGTVTCEPDDTGGPLTTRAVNLPVGSFLDVDAQLPIDFTSGADASPDFVNGAGVPLRIEFDEVSDDTSFVGSTFSVPQDYSSGGSFALGVSRPGGGGLTETVQCNVAVNNQGLPYSSGTVDITGSSGPSAVYTLAPSASYAAGDSVMVSCGVLAPFDNPVRLHSVEFRYQSVQ